MQSGTNERAGEYEENASKLHCGRPNSVKLSNRRIDRRINFILHCLLKCPLSSGQANGWTDGRMNGQTIERAVSHSAAALMRQPSKHPMFSHWEMVVHSFIHLPTQSAIRSLALCGGPRVKLRWGTNPRANVEVFKRPTKFMVALINGSLFTLKRSSCHKEEHFWSSGSHPKSKVIMAKANVLMEHTN